MSETEVIVETARKPETTQRSENEHTLTHTNVEGFLHDIHGRYEDPRNLPDKMQIVADLSDFLTIEAKQAEEEKDKGSINAEHILDMQDRFLGSIIAIEDADEPQLDDLKKHIENAAQEGGKNQIIFDSFQEFLNRPPEEQQEIPTEEIPDVFYKAVNTTAVLAGKVHEK
jgi:hypothetical protein